MKAAFVRQYGHRTKKEKILASIIEGLFLERGLVHMGR
jgi:hypothetical protein